jgi:hypothetical protein
MEGMVNARRELATLAPLLRAQLKASGDGSTVSGLSAAAARLRVIFLRFFEVLRERSELRNKFLLRCARMLQGMERENLTRESFASGDFGSDSCKRRTMPYWRFLLSSKRWNRMKSSFTDFGKTAPYRVFLLPYTWR